MKTLMVDGNSLFKNSFEPTVNSKEYEKNFNGIYLFLLRLRKILDSDRYTHLKIVFDGKNSGSLRRNVYPEYKFKREEKKRNSEVTEKSEKYDFQKKRLKTYLDYFCYTFEDDEVEADDIIAYYVKNKNPEEKITIVTGDFDLLQLISKDVEAYYLNKSFKNKSREVQRYEKNENRGNLIITYKNFKKIFGFPHENIALIKSICGDTSDEVKNIPGIKETTLFKLFPELNKDILSINKIKTNCLNLLQNPDVKSKSDIKKYTEISESTLINENFRIVDLNNTEFISESCKQKLSESNFFSNDKYLSKDPVSLLKELKADKLDIHINNNYNTLKNFFKPFSKTFKNERK